MNELEEVLDSLDMESYLDHMGIEYRTRPGSSGRQLNLKECPSCGNSKWKVYANEATGLGNCFSGSCGLGTFNKYKFVRAYLGNPPHGEVIRHIKEVAASMGWRPKKLSSAVVVPDTVQLPSSIELPDANGSNLAYLEARGVTGELARFFHLRYCVAGGYKASSGQGDIRQDYSGRVIIPIYDLEGVMKTFQGRDTTGTREPKYLFPPALPASGRFLYNAHNAWQSTDVVVGEGAFDVIAIHAALQADPGLRSIAAIGTFGMHLSADTDGNDQLGAFRDLAKEKLRRVILMWDSEPAALRAALKAAEKLSSIGLKALITILPKGKDPNEVSAHVVRERVLSAVDPTTAAGARAVMKAILF